MSLYICHCQFSFRMTEIHIQKSSVQFYQIIHQWQKFRPLFPIFQVVPQVKLLFMPLPKIQVIFHNYVKRIQLRGVSYESVVLMPRQKQELTVTSELSQ